MSEALLRRPAVQAKTGLSRSTLYAEMAAGRFPKPIRPYNSASMVAWVQSEIDAWIDQRVKAARTDHERDAVPA